jgi:hypothetical protein
MLPPAALPAWQAYRRMEQTKAAHFAALTDVEGAATPGPKPTLAQRAHLAALLAEHATAVADFKHALSTLGVAERAALAACLARINEAAGTAPGTH